MINIHMSNIKYYALLIAEIYGHPIFRSQSRFISAECANRKATNVKKQIEWLEMEVKRENDLTQLPIITYKSEINLFNIFFYLLFAFIFTSLKVFLDFISFQINMS